MKDIDILISAKNYVEPFLEETVKYDLIATHINRTEMTLEKEYVNPGSSWDDPNSDICLRLRSKSFYFADPRVLLTFSKMVGVVEIVCGKDGHIDITANVSDVDKKENYHSAEGSGEKTQRETAFSVFQKVLKIVGKRPGEEWSLNLDKLKDFSQKMAAVDEFTGNPFIECYELTFEIDESTHEIFVVATPGESVDLFYDSMDVVLETCDSFSVNQSEAGDLILRFGYAGVWD